MYNILSFLHKKSNSEIHQLKSRIIKYLIEHQNYNTFSIEANMPESYKINEYIESQENFNIITLPLQESGMTIVMRKNDKRILNIKNN